MIMNDPYKEEKEMLLIHLKQCGDLFDTGFIVTDPEIGEDGVVYVNEPFTTITGYTQEEVYGENLRFLFGEYTDLSVIQSIDRRLRKGESVTEDILHYRKDGSSYWSELVIQPLYGEDGAVLLVSSFIREITTRKINESLLEQQKHMFQGINDGENIETLLQSVCHDLGPFFSSEIACAYMFLHPEDGWLLRTSTDLPLSILSRIQETMALEVDFIKNQKVHIAPIEPSDTHPFKASWSIPIHNQSGHKSEVFLICVETLKPPTDIHIKYLEQLIPVIQITSNYFEQQSQLHSLAYYDLTTGLPNRYAFEGKFKQIIQQNKDAFVAVIASNQYTNIIDLYGRAAGDELFQQIAKRLRTMTRDSYIGRLSSAAILYTRERTGLEAIKFENDLRLLMSQPFLIAGKEMYISLKVGISLADHESSAEEMIRRADIALTEAKRIPGGTVSFYKDLHNEETIKEMTIANELVRALAVNGLDVYLQPKVDLATGVISSFEALARWNSPVLGQVPPGVFITIAENIGKIIELELVVFEKVLKWQRERMRKEKKMYQVAVNVSVDHFFHPTFLQSFSQLVAKFKVPPKYIRIEITESIGLVDFNLAKQLFEKLNQLGFEISIDDFGVGYSSLSYLPQLQVSELKIDRSFIKALHEPGTYAVVMTIIQLAKNLNVLTVAEGIEEVHQIEALVALGCEVGQGFYFYKPMPFEEINYLI